MFFGNNHVIIVLGFVYGQLGLNVIMLHSNVYPNRVKTRLDVSCQLPVVLQAQRASSDSSPVVEI